LQVVRVVLAVLSLPLVHRLMLEALEALVEQKMEQGQLVELVEPPTTLEALVELVEQKVEQVEQKMELGLLW